MKVAVVGGAGGVGASTTFNLISRGRRHDLVLLDDRAAMLTSHLMDLEQVLELEPAASVRAGTDADVADADVVVMTASVPKTLSPSRRSYAAGNAELADGLAALLPDGWNGILIVVTNPVDALVTRLRRRTGLDRRRVLGYTLNDTLRLRTGIAGELGVAPGRVAAWVLGEHGDSSVPLLGRVTVDGVPATLSAAQAASATEFVRTWFARHVALDSRRSSTWATGLGIARMVDALEHGADPWPASVVLAGEYGIDGVAVTVPVALGPGGAERIHEWELGDPALRALRAAAEAVRRTEDVADAAVRSAG